MTDALTDRLSTGVPGLDEILGGGLRPGRAYLVSGGPGSGKTTLGLHFLAAGVKAGETSLFITLEESEARIRQNAESLGLDLNRITFLDLRPDAGFFTEGQSYDLFSPAEVEQQPIAQRIIEQIEKLKPNRVFLDPMTQFRYLAGDVFQFRKQVLSFLRFLADHRTTTLYTSEFSSEMPDDDLRFMSDGIIQMMFAHDNRTISINKYRGAGFARGEHAMRIVDAGIEVYPRLVPEAYRQAFEIETIPFGVPELDEILHGGIERGTVTIISGPSGVGKTTLGLQFLREAAGRGEYAVLYTFEESVRTIVFRSENLNMPVHAMMDNNMLVIKAVESLRYSPDELAGLIRRVVEEHNARAVMIDSTSGYKLSFKDQDLESHLHSLCRYLKNMGATVILINEVEYVTGDFRATEMGISYLADNIIFIRQHEHEGQMKKSIGVLKKRLSGFEKTLHELEITPAGIKVKDVITGLQGILSGNPDVVDTNHTES